MQVKDILSRKGFEVCSILEDASVGQAIEKLVSRGIGSLVVFDRTGEMTGIISERHIIEGSFKYGNDLNALPVNQLMDYQPTTATEDSDIDEIMKIMTESRVRYVPITDQDRIIGLISIGDVVKAQLEHLEFENHHMRSYVFGVR